MSTSYVKLITFCFYYFFLLLRQPKRTGFLKVRGGGNGGEMHEKGKVSKARGRKVLWRDIKVL